MDGTLAPKPSRRRRWLIAVCGTLVGLVGALAALPWFLSTDAARRVILEWADQKLAPGRLEAASFQFSWFGPTRIDGFLLRDHQGDPTLESATVLWDRSLLQIIFDRPRYGTATFPGGHVRLVRDAKGEINLVETLRPILARDPKLDVTFDIPGGSLVVESPELPGPFEAARAEISLHLPVGLAPLQLKTDLMTESGAGRMKVSGEFGRREGDSTLHAELVPDQWPFHFERFGLTTTGLLTGKANLDREADELLVKSTLAVTEIDAVGEVLRGDHARLDRLAVEVDLAQRDDVWTIRRFQADSPMMRAEATGTYPPRDDSPTVVDARLDIPSLVRQLPRLVPMREGITLEGGAATLHATIRPTSHGEEFRAEALIAGVRGKRDDRVVQLRDPANLSAKIIRSSGSLSVEDLQLRTPFLALQATGDLDRGLEVTGTVELAGLQRQTAELIDFGDLELTGEGRLTGRYQREKGTYRGEVSLNLERFRLAGTPLGTLDEPEFHLDLNANGPIGELGLPKSWSEVRLALKAPSLKADVSLNESLAADLLMPLEIAGNKGLFQASARGRWEGRRLDLAKLRVEVTPALADARPMAIEVVGAYDAARGELTLKQGPGAGTALRLLPGGVEVTGLNGTTWNAEGAFSTDVAELEKALAGWLGRGLPDLQGTCKVKFRGRRDDAIFRLAARVEMPDLTGPPLVADAGRFDLHTTATLQLEYDRPKDLLSIQNVKMWGDIATFELAGTIDAPFSRRDADLNGTVALNDELLSVFLQERVEPEARIAVRPRPLRLRGPLSGPSLAAIARGLDAEIGADISHLDVYGMRFGPMPLALHAKDGVVTIDRVRTTLNGGRIDLRPVVILDDQRGIFLTFAQGSGVQGAEINEEVSRRVLSYATPLLYNATSVRGFVSARIDSASVPLLAEADAKTDVRGIVGFQQVTFHPGPLGRQVLGMVRLQDITLMRLDQDVPFQIIGDRVHQPGMSVPLIGLASVDLAGSVGFDRSLDLDLDVPIVPDFLDRVPIAGDIVGGLKIKVPVRGTLKEPIVDKVAFDKGMKKMGDGLGQRGRAVGEGILDRLRELIPVIPDIKKPKQP